MKIPTTAIIRNQFNFITVSLVNGFDKDEVLYTNNVSDPTSERVDDLYKEFVSETDEFIINSVSLEINNHYKDAKYFDFIKCLTTKLYNKIFTDLCYPNAEKYNVFEEITDKRYADIIKHFTRVYYRECIESGSERVSYFKDNDTLNRLVDPDNAICIGNVILGTNKQYSVFITRINGEAIKTGLDLNGDILDVFYLEIKDMINPSNPIIVEQIVLSTFKVYINADSYIDELVNTMIFEIMDKDIKIHMEEKMIIAKNREKESEYIGYIENHIRKVWTAFSKYGKQMCDILNVDYEKTRDRLYQHDASKHSEAEFGPYRRKFYPTEYEMDADKDQIEYEFNLAWLHHIHSNPHHPEHWIFYDDNGNKTVYDMPDKYIIEMICDWESFRKEDGTGGAYEYYHSGKGRKEGLLTDATRAKVEALLEIVK